MLQVFIKNSPSKALISKTYSALSPILKNNLDVPIKLSEDFNVLPETKVILGMGGDALDFFAQAGVYGKNLSFKSVRCRVHSYHTIPTVITFAPDIGDVDFGFYTDMLTDVGGAIRLYKTGSWNPVYGSNYRYVPDFSNTIANIKHAFQENASTVDVTIDLETLGLDPYFPGDLTTPPAFIISIAITWQEGQADVVRFSSPEEAKLALAKGGVIWEQLNWLLNTPHIFIKGANLKYDFHWLAVHAELECTNFVLDSTLIGSLLNENRANGLDVHTKIYVPAMGGYADEFNNSINKGRMDLVPPDKFLNYAGGDTDAAFRVQKILKQEILQDPALTKFYFNILHPGCRAFEMVERGGVHIDHDRYREVGFKLEEDLDRLLTRAKHIIGGRLTAKHFDVTRHGGLNLNKASLLKDFMFSPTVGLGLKPRMFTNKTKEPSTSYEHLAMFKDVPEAAEFVSIFDEYGSTAKTYETYYVGFRVHIRSDGRFHPTYWLFAGDKKVDEGGTNTGRLSAKDPAFQTLIKHSKWAKILRKAFTAPEGYLVLERDYSQGELRVVACIANEETMIQAYRNGKDLHVETAAPFAGHTYESLLALKEIDLPLFEATRQLGKAGNFGLVYGMQVLGFMAYAYATYGVKLTEEVATNFRNSYFKTYAGLVRYHNEYQQFARIHQFVRSPLGRPRHLPLIKSPIPEYRAKAERQSINSPVQSTLSDMLVWSMALEHQQGLTKVAPSFGMTHDSANNYVPIDGHEKLVVQHLDIMQGLPFHLVGWKPQLQFIADAKIGPSMGELSPFKVQPQ